MTSRLYPADAVAGNPTYNGRALRQVAVAPFVAGATATRPLGARSGVRPGTSTSTVAATSAALTVQPFAGVLDLATANEAGPYSFAFDAAVTKTINAAGSNPRIDLVCVQLTDPAESVGSGGPGVDIAYAPGTAAASPQVPATPANSFVIARINVPASGGGTPTVSWVAPYVVGAGGTLPVDTLTNLNAIPGWVGGQAQVYNDTAIVNGSYYWNPTTSTWMRSGLTLAGFNGQQLRGTLPTAGQGLIVQAGNEIFTPNSAGTFSVVFPTPFPNGLIHINAINGDSTASSGAVFSRLATDSNTATATGIQMVAKVGTTAVTGSTRVLWFAVGW